MPVLNRRDFLAAAACGAAGLWLPSVMAGATDAPNIVFIFIDDMGFADPSCFGNPKMKTPHIDRLAEDGIRLTGFYVNSPICSPSRVAVTTGQYPGRWGIHSYLNSRALNRSRGMADFLDPKAPTAARLLKQSGYATAHFGKWHMGGGRDVGDAPLPQAYGFDESLVSFEGLGDRILPPGGLSDASAKLKHGTVSRVQKHEMTRIYVDRAIGFMQRHRRQPFFLRLFPNDVHDEHRPAPGAEEKWQSATDNPFERKFFAVLEEVDRQLGRLLEEIDRLELAARTLVVFTSDNGPTDWPRYYRAGQAPPGFTGPYRGRKWSLYEGGIRMPFIARWPGRIPAGATNDGSVVCGIDLPPTFCAVAGVKVPGEVDFDGEDMSRALFGEAVPRQRPVFWQYGAPHARLKPGAARFVSPAFAVRDGAWKLLMQADGSDAQLFNLATDPGESRNLLDEEPARARRLADAISSWAADVGYEVTASALRPPVAAAAMTLAGRQRGFVNHGVRLQREAESLSLHFEAPGVYLDLPRAEAPAVAGRRLRIRAVVEAVADHGVVLAHGGDRCGYSLYLAGGKPAFSVCVDWHRTTIVGAEPMTPGRRRLEAELSRGGVMRLMVDGRTVAEGRAPGLLKTEPGDSLQIGADRIKPVGDYAVDNGFLGTIRDPQLTVQ